MSFSIVGQRYRFWGRTYLEIDTRFAEPWQVADGGSQSSWGDENAPGGSPLLEEEIKVTTACHVRPFVLTSGLLAPSGGEVDARIGDRTIRLRKIPLPPSLGTNGVLVVGVTATVPSGFSLQTRSGRWIRLERISSGHTVPEGCDGQEREWVRSHFAHAYAAKALAAIVECLQHAGFEVGAPDESGFGRAWQSQWRRFRSMQNTCRRDTELAAPSQAVPVAGTRRRFSRSSRPPRPVTPS